MLVNSVNQFRYVVSIQQQYLNIFSLLSKYDTNETSLKYPRELQYGILAMMPIHMQLSQNPEHTPIYSSVMTLDLEPLCPNKRWSGRISMVI